MVRIWGGKEREVGQMKLQGGQDHFFGVSEV